MTLITRPGRGDLPPPILRDKIKVLTYHGTRQQAHPGTETVRRCDHAGTTLLRGVARSRRQENRRAYPAGETGTHPPGGGSGGPYLAAPVVRPHSAHFEQPGQDAGERPGGGPGIQHRTAPPRPGDA